MDSHRQRGYLLAMEHGPAHGTVSKMKLEKALADKTDD